MDNYINVICIARRGIDHVSGFILKDHGLLNGIATIVFVQADVCIIRKNTLYDLECDGSLIRKARVRLNCINSKNEGSSLRRDAREKTTSGQKDAIREKRTDSVVCEPCINGLNINFINVGSEGVGTLGIVDSWQRNRQICRIGSEGCDSQVLLTTLTKDLKSVDVVVARIGRDVKEPSLESGREGHRQPLIEEDPVDSIVGGSENPGGGVAIGVASTADSVAVGPESAAARESVGKNSRKSGADIVGVGALIEGQVAAEIGVGIFRVSLGGATHKKVDSVLSFTAHELGSKKQEFVGTNKRIRGEEEMTRNSKEVRACDQICRAGGRSGRSHTASGHLVPVDLCSVGIHDSAVRSENGTADDNDGRRIGYRKRVSVIPRDGSMRGERTIGGGGPLGVVKSGQSPV